MSTKNISTLPLCLQQSVIDVFRVQVGMEIQMESVNSQGTVPAFSVVCMSVLGLKDTDYQGSLALGFPRDTFLSVVETMFGEKQTEIDAQNADACGELLNIIYAAARVKINQSGFEFQPSIPSTIQGKDIAMALANSAKSLKLYFQSPKGPFMLELSLKKLTKG